MDLSQVHLLRPWWLLALAPLVLLLIMLAKRSSERAQWDRIVDPQLMAHVVETPERRTRGGRILGVGVGGLLAIIALSGPSWTRLPQPVYRSVDGLVVVLDLSRSMLATDLAPNRLTRARFKIKDILQARGEGQTALVVYAGSPYVVSPLTDDADTIAEQVDVLHPDLLPDRGSRADLAIQRATALLQQAGVSEGAVLLITDGTNPDRTGAAARALRATGYRLHVLGVGTPEGAPIRLAEGGYLYATDGTIVIPRMQGEALQTLAGAGGGRYRTITSDDRDVRSLLAARPNRGPSDTREATGMRTERWRDEGVWLLLALLPVSALAFRKGGLLLLLVGILSPLPRPVHADVWNDLWKRPDQQASRALARGEAERAAELFRDPAWRAAAQYRAGQFDAASRTLESLEDTMSTYNLGNALARQGDYQGALRAYDQALAEDPSLEDAAYNRALIRQLLQQQGAGEASPEDGGSSQEAESSAQSSPSGSERPPQPGSDPPTADGPGGLDSRTRPQAADSARREDQASPSQPPGPPRPEADAGEPGRVDDVGDPRDDSKGTKSAIARGNTPEGRQDNRETEHAQPDETQQAVNQWLRRIPDDPGGLLRRKFLRQYERGPKSPINDSSPW